MERAQGFSLKDFVERSDSPTLSVVDAIQLSQNLIGIIKQIHARNIFYRNLSPENIMVYRQNQQTPVSQAQLTLINFSQALTSSGQTDYAVPSSTVIWCQAAQSKEQALAATVDTTGICAVLLWLITKVNPRYDTEETPHQQVRDKLNQMITVTLNAAGMSLKNFRGIVLAMSLLCSLDKDGKSSVTLSQLKTYFNDTFDRAFGYPHHPLWTVADLESRLESIRELLLASDSGPNGLDSILQKLTSMEDTPRSLAAVSVRNAEDDAFEKASKAFQEAKQALTTDGQHQYSWSDGRCIWVKIAQSTINERRNDDILMYDYRRGKTSTSFSVIITCLAEYSEGLVMTLSISSSANGKNIRMPIGQFPIGQDYSKPVQENFRRELENLLLAIYKERKSM